MLPKLDNGLLKVIFDKYLTQIVEDCKDRPAESKPRTLTLELAFVPRSENPGRNECDGVSMAWKVKPKAPDQISRPYDMSIRKNMLFFNPDSPDNIDQTTMFDNDLPEGAR